MKKKLLSMVLCAVLCLGMSTTTFAANSPSVNNSGNQGTVTNPSPSIDNTTGVTATTEINGQKINVIVMSVEDATLTEEQSGKIETILNAINSGNSSKIFEMQKELVKGITNKTIKSVGYSKLIDVTLPNGIEVPENGSLVVSIADPNVKPDMNIVVFHLKADGTWEQVPATVGNGAIYPELTSLSPIYYMEVAYETSAAGTGTGTANTTTTTTTDSPKTGESNMNLFVILLAVVALGGAVVFGARKVNYIK